MVSAKNSNAGKCFTKLILCAIKDLKVDRENHFWRPGFLHIIICVLLGYKASNFVKKLNVTDV